MKVISREPSVVLHRVTKHYGSGPQAVAALADVTLEVPARQFLSVIGASGSGKSTLLNVIAGLDTPSTGSVTVMGHDLARLSDDARSDLRLRRIGFVFQAFNLFPSFTAEENVLWPLELLGVRWRAARQRAIAMLDRIGLPRAAAQRFPAELSGGEQQRLAIARALVTEPGLLVADEPTGNLDSRTGESILDLLRDLNVDQGVTVILVTHSTFAASYGHRTVELRDGRVVRDVRAPDGTSPGRVIPLRD
jgi:putative ABC transport system ATP-binding protein